MRRVAFLCTLLQSGTLTQFQGPILSLRYERNDDVLAQKGPYFDS